MTDKVTRQCPQTTTIVSFGAFLSAQTVQPDVKHRDWKKLEKAMVCECIMMRVWWCECIMMNSLQEAGTQQQPLSVGARVLTEQLSGESSGSIRSQPPSQNIPHHSQPWQAVCSLLVSSVYLSKRRDRSQVGWSNANVHDSWNVL